MNFLRMHISFGIIFYTLIWCFSISFGEYHLLLCRSSSLNLTHFRLPEEESQCRMHLFDLNFNQQYAHLQTNLFGKFSVETLTSLILNDHFYHHSYRTMRVKNSKAEHVDELKEVTERRIKDAMVENKNSAKLKAYAKKMGKEKTQKNNLVLIEKTTLDSSGFMVGHLFEVENGVYLTTKKTLERALVGRNQGDLHLTEDFILETHDRITRETRPSMAGKYRDFNLHMEGGGRRRGRPLFAPHHRLLRPLMQQFIHWFNTEAELSLHPVEKAIYTYLNLVDIHPFHDGNGRTGRQLMTLILLREGFSPPGILREERDLHYYLSDLARHGHPRHFAHFILNSIQRMSQHARPSMLF